jgi:subtilase family serine protease
MLKKTDAQQTALEQLLQQQQDPASPNYHDWLTPEQYADRFGLSQNDLDKISAWLQSEGFSVEYVARGRNWLSFSGTAGQVRTALHTDIHRYSVDGEMHFAAGAEPSVPASLEPVVEGFLGLDDFYPKAPKHPLPAFTAGDGTHSLAPDDLAAIYDIGRLHQAKINGAGQSIVIVGESRINSADIQGFRAKYNLPALSPQIILNPNSSDPGTTIDYMKEADMDLEWAGAVAPNAALIYVYGSSADQAAFYAIDNNLAPVISESFGNCESQSESQYSSIERSEAQKANLQGITWLASSGDSGAFDCDYRVSIAVHGSAVGFPASIPEVTAVGGTEFNDGTGADSGAPPTVPTEAPPHLTFRKKHGMTRPRA